MDKVPKVVALVKSSSKRFLTSMSLGSSGTGSVRHMLGC